MSLSDESKNICKKIKIGKETLKILTWEDLREGNILIEIRELKLLLDDLVKIVRLK